MPVFIFFFQAEDGIRDYKVTGVQTCALPISQMRGASMRVMASAPSNHRFRTDARITTRSNSRSSNATRRSEERRVGKESRCGRWQEESKKRKIEAVVR